MWHKILVHPHPFISPVQNMLQNRYDVEFMQIGSAIQRYVSNSNNDYQKISDNLKLNDDILLKFPSWFTENASVLKNILDKSLKYQTRQYGPWIEAMDLCLKHEKLSLILLWNDVTATSKSLTYLGRKYGVPTLHISHGIPGRVPVHGKIWSDKIAVFGESTRKLYLDNGNPLDKIVVTGNPYWDNFSTCSFDDAIKLKKIFGLNIDHKTVLFAPTWYHNLSTADVPMLKVKKDLEIFLDTISQLKLNNKVDLLVKLHSGQEDKAALYERKIKECGIFFKIITDGSPLPLIQASDVIVCAGSMAVEALLAGKPLIYNVCGHFESKLHFDYCMSHSFTVDKAPFYVALNRDDLSRGLYMALDCQVNFKVEDIKKFLHYHNGPCDGKATERVTALAMEMATNMNNKKKLGKFVSPVSYQKRETYYSNTREDIPSMITGSPHKILEVGCAEGAMGELLKKRFNCEYVGVEIDGKAAQKAKERLDFVFTADVENTNLEEFHIAEPRFDYIIYGDVLEHLYDPWTVIYEHKKLLKDGGYIIVSIPNVRHLHVIESLVNGCWTYKDEGILDSTHLRFFTLQEIKKMLFNCGFNIVDVECITTPFYDHKTIQEYTNIELPKLTIKNVSKDEMLELSTVQFIIKAKKDSVSESVRIPKCSIIIPAFNQVEYTKQCIEAIFKNTSKSLFELIVVDNNSTDGTKEFLSSLKENIKVISNQKNYGFAKACNQGANKASGETLIFLNNDTIPLPGWLEEMVQCAISNDNVGIVGSKLLYPDGKIQHAGIGFIKGIPDHPLRNLPGDHPEANIFKELDMVTGACLLIRRDLFYDCGGFDELYKNGVEDIDLCLKVRSKGYKVIYNPKSTLYHYEARTDGRFNHVNDNLMLFFSRWKGFFDENGRFTNKNRNQKIFVKWEGSQFVNHSLALVNREMCIKLSEKQDIELSIIPYEPHKFGKEEDPERFSFIQERLNRPLSSSVDVHIRHQWPPNFTPPPIGHWVMIQPWEYGALPKDWVEPMRWQVDELWVPSNYVREVYINSGIPDSKVFVIPNGVDYNNFNSLADPMLLDTRKSFKFLFVGGTIPRKGIDVLLDAYTFAFSRVDDVCLVIKDIGADTFYRGQSTAEQIAAIQKDGDAPEILYLKEDIPEKNMAGLYTACDCLVHPYRGEGFGLPVAEAMACGLPVLITKGGACDDFCNVRNSIFIESKRKPIVMNDTTLCDTGWVLEPSRDDLIRRLRFLYENQDEGRKIGAVAAREIRELVSWEKSADLVSQRIKELKNRPIIRLQTEKSQKTNEDYDLDLLLYTSIQEQISNGDFEGAIAKLENLIGSKPELAVAYNDLGVLYHRQEKNTLALARYRRAVDLEPGNTNFRKNLADLLVVTFGEYEEALQHYVAVLAADPKDAEALFATGHICDRLERYDDAAEFYERVLEIEPDNSDAKNWLTKMGEKASAKCIGGNLNERYLALLSEIDHKDLAGAIQKIEHFIELYPKHGQAYNDLGVLYFNNDCKDKVLAHYFKAIELEPENVTFRKNLADFLYVNEGRVEEALEHYLEALRMQPDDADTLLIAGHICAAIERFEDAMCFYNKVLNIEPGNIDARNNLEALKRPKISMLYKEERGEEKQNDDTKIIQGEPQAPVDEVPIAQDGVVEDLINKAGLLFQQERIDQAVDAMLKAIAVNPSDGRAYVEMAGQLVNHGRHENALEVLAEMPTKQPVAVEMQKLLVEGYAEEGMGNYAAAKKCSDGVLAREFKNANALNLNGILAYRNGDKATAEQYFKRAIELDSEYGEPHTNLGALVWENSEPKMALEHYERGFSISPTDIDVANAYHEAVSATGEYRRAEKAARSALKKFPQCRKILYLLVDTLIRQEKNEEALKELEDALSTFGIDKGLLDTALAFRERVGKIKKNGSAKNPCVSLCMIVKNEEANLARCLASVKPIVDEMIVIDTGSTDRTKDIAEFYGAQVYDFEWNDDFSEARNFSLSKAKGDWILIMDADEIISPQDYKRFRKLTAKKPSGLTAYSIITRNYCNMTNTIGWIPNSGQYASEEVGLGWLSSEKVRLFRKNSQIKFEGAVHEMVDPVLKRLSIGVKKCSIPVHHYGRLNTDILARKDQAYFEIGRKKLLNDGGDIGTVRELAVQATVLERNSEAIELWQTFLSMEPGEAAAADAYVNMVSVYIRMKEYDKALSLARKAVSLNPQMKEAQYNLGITELYIGNDEAAFNTFKKLTECHPDFPPAQFLLAASNCCRNGATEAKFNFRKIKQSAFGPTLTYSVTELAEGLMAANQHIFAFRLLKKTIEEEIVSKAIMKLYSECLVKIKESDSNTEDLVLEQCDVLPEAMPECN